MLRIAHHVNEPGMPVDILWFEIESVDGNGLAHLFNVEGEDRIAMGFVASIKEMELKINLFVEGYKNAAARYKKADPAR